MAGSSRLLIPCIVSECIPNLSGELAAQPLGAASVGSDLQAGCWADILHASCWKLFPLASLPGAKSLWSVEKQPREGPGQMIWAICGPWFKGFLQRAMWFYHHLWTVVVLQTEQRDYTAPSCFIIIISHFKYRKYYMSFPYCMWEIYSRISDLLPLPTCQKQEASSIWLFVSLSVADQPRLEHPAAKGWVPVRWDPRWRGPRPNPP